MCFLFGLSFFSFSRRKNEGDGIKSDDFFDANPTVAANSPELENFLLGFGIGQDIFKAVICESTV